MPEAICWLCDKGFERSFDGFHVVGGWRFMCPRHEAPPTLREMTEWGWFQPEPDDPDPLYPVFFGWDWRSKPSYTVRWIGGWPVNPS